MKRKAVRVAVVASGVSVAILLFGIGLLQSAHLAPWSVISPQAMPTPQPRIMFDEQELIGHYNVGLGNRLALRLQLKPDHQFGSYWTSGQWSEVIPNPPVREPKFNIAMGRWAWDGEVMVLKPKDFSALKDDPFSIVRQMNVRLIPVKWGKRIYLIVENEMPGFCAATKDHNESFLNDEPDNIDLASYREQKQGSRAWGDDMVRLPVYGKPIVPARFQEFVDQGESLAQVVAVMGDRVTLRQSEGPRLHVGSLLCESSDEDKCDLVVTQMNKQEVTARTRSSFRFVPVTEGTVYTTGNYRHRPAEIWHQPVKPNW